MDIYLDLAKKTIKQFLKGQKLPEIKNLPPNLERQAGCFVSLHSKGDELRGCIGTILSTSKNLASEIMSNAIAACQDPRFLPVSLKEYENLEIQVDILSEPEPISSENSLDPKKYGVIVKAAGGRTGLLLPDLEGIDDKSYQVAIARKKAGISPSEPIFLYRFTVDRHKEK